jgi:hypothetical protein
MPVAAEYAVAEPTEFVAVTATRIVAPTSAESSGSLGRVAPVIAWQDDPELEQRCH